MFRLMCILSICAAPAQAQSPLSAIEWLSESISHPPEFRLSPDAPQVVPPAFMDISVKVADSKVSADAIGLLAPPQTGFSADLWGPMRAQDIIDLLDSYPNEGLPEAKNLFRRVLLAQTNPPLDDMQSGQVLSARIERLIQIGALDAAEALVGLNTTLTPKLFAQMFDIAILTQRTTKVCALLAGAPALSNDLSTRVYCLARSGDWNAAAITLSLGASLSAIDPAREEMLVRFLDPELFEGEPDPEIPTPLNVMDFVLREAVFLPRPSGLLPLPYLYRDIGTRAPQRAKMEASERLVKAGSMPASLLFSAYRDGQAASSGGVWGRAKSIQALDLAFKNGVAAEISTSLGAVFEAFAPLGLLSALAEEYADILDALSYIPPYEAVRGDVVNLLLLAGKSPDDWGNPKLLSPNQILASSIALTGRAVSVGRDDALLIAVESAFSNVVPNTPKGIQLQSLLADGLHGSAIFAALELLSNGRQSDPSSIHTGLFILNAVGQSEAAKRLAVQILLLPSEG